jgi:RND superfamily putative drug exporter
MGVVTIRSIGLGGALVVAWSVLGAMTLIPAVLSILGPRVNRLRVLAPLRLGRQRQMAPLDELASSGGFWHGLALRVMRHPIATLLGAMLILFLLAAPIASMRLGVPDGHILPARLGSRQGLDLTDKHFAAASPGATAAVRLDAPVLSQRGREELAAYIGQLRGTQGVDHVRSTLDAYSAVLAAMPANAAAQLSSLPPAADPLTLLPPQAQAAFNGLARGRSTVVSIFLTDDIQTPGADATTDRLRAIRPSAGVNSLIGGNEPYDLDFIRVLYSDFPKAVGFTLLATFVLLLIMLRSVVLPLKAIAMNLISLGASFGAMVFLFQQGHAAGLLNFIPVNNVAATIPIIMFATQFGLSMDYEVFLLSRIREEYLRSGDNEAAVARGLELTGRIITSAALVMVVVFGFFAFAELVIMKEIGVGLAVAILVDATIVRALLVPAAMRLLGRANWWPGLRGRLGPPATASKAGEAA